jgi:D-3-phosphoglycerate dehydrogenase
MNAASRLNVIYIQQPGAAGEWDEILISSISRNHNVHVFEPDQPPGPQFESVDAVVLMGAENPEPNWVEAAKGAKLWQLISVGYDDFDVDRVAGAGIPVCHCPGSTSAPGLAESGILFMLLIVKKYNESQAEMAAGTIHHPMGVELSGKLLGLIGFGASGRGLADLALGFGMRLAIAEPMEIGPEDLEKYKPDYVVQPGQMERIFVEADFVSLHLPLTPETRCSIGAELIGRMKPDACLINLARGDLVDQEALFQALLEGRIGGIGTDVHAGVFPDKDHPVFRHPRFYALPHVAGTTMGTVQRRAEACVENLDRLASGKPLTHVVGPAKV